MFVFRCSVGFNRYYLQLDSAPVSQEIRPGGENVGGGGENVGGAKILGHRHQAA